MTRTEALGLSDEARVKIDNPSWPVGAYASPATVSGVRKLILHYGLVCPLALPPSEGEVWILV